MIAFKAVLVVCDVRIFHPLLWEFNIEHQIEKSVFPKTKDQTLKKICFLYYKRYYILIYTNELRMAWTRDSVIEGKYPNHQSNPLFAKQGIASTEDLVVRDFKIFQAKELKWCCEIALEHHVKETFIYITCWC